MTNSTCPPTLRQKRGLKASLLRRMPQAWHELPTTADVPIPHLRMPNTNALDCIIKPCLSPNSFTCLSVDDIYAPSMQFIVNVQASRLDAFYVCVFGICYSNYQNPDATLHKPDTTELTGFEGKAKRKAHPYATLYGLLYPPPDDIAADQIPQYAELRPYQQVGVEFLVNREHALLADDPGLGKTAQASIAIAILRRSERVGRTLIVCPRALVRQWEQEAKRWAGLHIHPVKGTPVIRKRVWESFPGVLITTPNLILNDIEIIKKCHFDLVVCDDVSLLKNPGKITNAVRRIPRTRSWILNGTPLEIKPEDFVNVMEFVRPGLFSATERANAPSQSTLQRRVKPYFLRRRKQDHLEGLPPIVHNGPIQLEMESAQREAYRLAEEEQWKELQAAGVTINKTHIFSLINALLQICNVHLPSRQSAKAEAIEQELDKILDTERPIVKAIVFSRWVKTLEFLAQRWAKYCPQVYHGGLNDKERDAVLQKFRSEGCLLLMSTKAGSKGLNLQEANYVFHFDRSWNPVDEMQAEARCWRMGQKSDNVFVYGYTQADTIEERIHQVLLRRKAQFEQYVNSMAEDTDVLAEAQWSIEELIELLRPTKTESSTL